MEELKKFLAALQEDEGLQKKVADAVKALPKDSTEENAAQCVIAVAADAGYTFTKEDMAALNEQAAKNNGDMEVSLDEMAQAAGGETGYGGGVTLSGCAKFGVGFGVNATSSGYGICFVMGFGKKGTFCVAFGGSFDTPMDGNAHVE